MKALSIVRNARQENTMTWKDSRCAKNVSLENTLPSLERIAARNVKLGNYPNNSEFRMLMDPLRLFFIPQKIYLNNNKGYLSNGGGGGGGGGGLST